MNLTIVNENSGSVSAHKAGCADLKKARHLDSYTEEYGSQVEVFRDYNSDFIAEAGFDPETTNPETYWECNSYPIDFKNCCKGLPKQ